MEDENLKMHGGYELACLPLKKAIATTPDLDEESFTRGQHQNEDLSVDIEKSSETLKD